MATVLHDSVPWNSIKFTNWAISRDQCMKFHLAYKEYELPCKASASKSFVKSRDIKSSYLFVQFQISCVVTENDTKTKQTVCEHTGMS